MSAPDSRSSEPTYRRRRPPKLMSLFMGLPRDLYVGPIADLFAWRSILRLTTTGRKSGQPRSTCVSFLPLTETGETHYVIFSGWGVSSNWYRNLRANPEVTIRVGRRTLQATAEPVQDPARRRELMLKMREHSDVAGPPKVMRPLLRLTGVFDYDNEIRVAVEHAEELPVIELVPRRG